MELNKIYNINAMEGIKKLEKESIDMIFTSPPYWGLRDYGYSSITVWDESEKCDHKFLISHIERDVSETDIISEKAKEGQGKRNTFSGFCQKCGAWKGQLGLEPSADLYIKHLCDIFNNLKDSLKKEGSLWVVIGDTYNSHSTGKGSVGGIESNYRLKRDLTAGNYKKPNVKDKSLVLIPFRFAIEMVKRGWILRNVIIWHKPNAMPSSVKDRFTVDFEYLFFFTKNKKYFFRQQFEPLKIDSIKRERRGMNENKWNSLKNYFNIHTPTMSRQRKFRGYEGIKEEFLKRKGRNKRAVWEIPTSFFKGAHFAVFPIELCKTPILACCPEGGIVLDPFMGSGTTAVASKELGRNFIGFEINPEYVKMANERILNHGKKDKDSLSEV